MEQWRKDGRAEVVMVDLEELVPKDCCVGLSMSWTTNGCMKGCPRTTAMTTDVPGLIRSCL